MRERFKKELREWAIPALALLALQCCAWVVLAGPVSAFLAPRQEPTIAVLVCGALFAALLGYGQLEVERGRGTLGYLAHRGGGRRALLEGKIAAGVVLALGFTLLPPLFAGVWHAFGPLGAIVQPARALEHALAGLVVLPAYACGLVIAQLGSRWLALLLVPVVAVGCFVFSWRLPVPVYQVSFWAIPVYALGQIALAALVASLARALFVRGHERAAGLPWRLQLHAALVALIFLVMPLWFMTNTSISFGQHSLFGGYPSIARYPDGHYAAVERDKIEVPAGPDGKPTIQIVSAAVPLQPGLRAYVRRGPLLDAGLLTRYRRWWELQYWNGRTEPGEIRDKDGKLVNLDLPGTDMRDTVDWSPHKVYLDTELGLVRRFHGTPIGEVAPARRDARKMYMQEDRIRRPDGKPLSDACVVESFEMGLPLIVDQSDRTLWALDFGASGVRLAQLELPGGDSLVRLHPEEAWEPAGWASSDPVAVVLEGSRGSYRWTASGFVVVDSAAGRAWWMPQCRTEFGEATFSSVTARLRERDAQGQVGAESPVVYEHRFEPRTTGEATAAAALRSAILCLAPIASALALGGTSWGPLAVAADVDTTYLVHLALGLLLAVLTWRQLARSGATTREKLLWTSFNGLLGVFAYLFFVLLSPRPASAESPEVRTESARGLPARAV